MYLSYINENTPEFYNPNHKTCKLKARLYSHFGDRLEFWKPNYRSELVFSSGLRTGEAVEMSFEAAASEKRMLEDAALTLRRHILDAFSQSPTMPWPPSDKYFDNPASQPPNQLKDIISIVISGKSEEQLTSRKKTVANSIAEDMCYATTQGKWKIPKYILLSISIHHLTGSAEIVSILNRLGHYIYIYICVIIHPDICTVQYALGGTTLGLTASLSV